MANTPPNRSYKLGTAHARPPPSGRAATHLQGLRVAPRIGSYRATREGTRRARAFANVCRTDNVLECLCLRDFRRVVPAYALPMQGTHRYRLSILFAVVVVGVACSPTTGDPDGSPTQGSPVTSTPPATPSGVKSAGCNEGVFPGSRSESFQHDGIERSYDIVVPETAQGVAMPLVLSFPGFTNPSKDQPKGPALRRMPQPTDSSQSFHRALTSKERPPAISTSRRSTIHGSPTTSDSPLRSSIASRPTCASIGAGSSCRGFPMEARSRPHSGVR